MKSPGKNIGNCKFHLRNHTLKKLVPSADSHLVPRQPEAQSLAAPDGAGDRREDHVEHDIALETGDVSPHNSAQTLPSKGDKNAKSSTDVHLHIVSRESRIIYRLPSRRPITNKPALKSSTYTTVMVVVLVMDDDTFSFLFVSRKRRLTAPALGPWRAWRSS